MLADRPARLERRRSRGYDAARPSRRLRSPSDPPPTRTAHVTPFDRLGRFVVRRARLVIGAWAVLLARWPCRSRRRRPGALSAGGFILDDLESARAKAILEDRARRAAVGARRRLLEPDARGRHAGVRAGRRGGDARRPRRRRTWPGSCSHLLQPRQVSADGHTAYDIVLLDLPPDDSPDALPILRERLRDAPGPDGRAGRRPGVLRRRPGRLRARPPAQRAHLAAARRARAAARLRVARRGGRPARRRRGGASSSRWPASSSSRRSCR